MRMSSGITVTILGGLMLTACLTSRGCGHYRVVRAAPEHTWYDTKGQRIAEKWTTTADGKRQPDPHPYDRYGQAWVYDASGTLVPPLPPATTTYHRNYWWWGGSGYRSSGSTYSSGSGGSSVSRPSTTGSSSSSSSVTRGGFGSIGSSSGS